MNSVRVWIVVLMLVSFLAGTAAGKILTDRERAGEAERGALSDYESLFASEFELSDERKRLLRVLLQHYDQELLRVRNEHLAVYRSAIEPDLRRLGLEYNQYIRDKVLPPRERQRFAELAAMPVSSSASAPTRSRK